MLRNAPDSVCVTCLPTYCTRRSKLYHRPRGWLARLWAGRESQSHWAGHFAIALDMGTYKVSGLPLIRWSPHRSGGGSGSGASGTSSQSPQGNGLLHLVQILPQRCVGRLGGWDGL